MNIFVLHEDSKKAVKFYYDKHVIKMILETAQLLCNAHHIITNNNNIPYKKTHIHHPCTLWCIKSLNNYEWLLNLLKYLLIEYNYRFNKIHKTSTVYNWLLLNNNINLPSLGLIDFPLVMKNEYKINNNAVLSYRNLYMTDKIKLLKYTKRKKPKWLIV